MCQSCSALKGLPVVVFTILLFLVPNSTEAASVECSVLSDSAQAVTSVDTVGFLAYRKGLPYQSLEYRDLEFLWDPNYGSTLPAQTRTTLDQFAFTLTRQFSANPLRIPVSDFNLIYSYFRRPDQGAAYTIDPSDTNSVAFGQGEATSYKPSDRSHVDTYIFEPSRTTEFDGRYPTRWLSPEEDVSTFHALGDAKPFNSITIRGPGSSDPSDTTGTGWTSPDRIANVRFDHEFRHGLPGVVDAGVFGELFSAGAEAIGGNGTQAAPGEAEVPYTWSLFALSGSTTCSNVRGQRSNYQGRSAFAAYLAYNFRNADTSATLQGVTDDLLHRWAITPDANLASLRGLLGDDSCATCAAAAYFHPGGVALSDTLRLAMLLHNWRVANYVNAPARGEGQYGYPAQFGFAPSRQLGAWQRLDGCDLDDVVAVPSEITLTPASVTRDTVLRDVRTSGSGSYPMVITPFGSEYWLIHADGGLQQPGNELVITVYPDSSNPGFVQQWCDSAGYAKNWTDARLFASTVSYSGQADSLWDHPEMVVSVGDPKWCGIDSLGGGVLQFIVPSFGWPVQSVLLVLSLGDGEGQAWTADGSLNRLGVGYSEWLSYRIRLGVRRAPYASTNPIMLPSDNSIREDEPSFSPDGMNVAYTEHYNTAIPQIYIRSIDGTTRTKLFANSTPLGQSAPDWSPRGDLIAYEDYRQGWPYPDIHLYNLVTQQHSILTPALDGSDEEPAFSPNGQSVAYVSHLVDSFGDLTGNWILRRINLDGSENVTLVTSSAVRPVRSPRWSPDGVWVYFTAGDSLYAVGSGGGGQGLVVERGEILNHAASFDLHRGHGAIVFEEVDSVAVWVDCWKFGVFEYVNGRFKRYPFRRISLRDTLERLPLPEFQQPFAAYFGPRWSYDGTRIAYSSNAADLGSGRDIYIGQVSWNHAPKFVNAPRDTTIPSTCGSIPFTATFSATDPDGEAVTYEAAYLPPGASLSPGGVFTWPNPIASPGDHYVVFRVLDGSGGVDQRVVNYTVATDPARPAAVLDDTPTMGLNSAILTWTDTGDDSLTGTACRVVVRYGTSPITEANFFGSTDTLVTGPPGPAGTVHCAEAAQPNQLSSCTWYYFALKTQDDAGNWSALSSVVSGKTKCSGFTQVACTGGTGGALIAQGSGTGGWTLENDVLGNAGPDSLSEDRQHLGRDSHGNQPARVRLSRRGSTGASLDEVDLSFADHPDTQELFMTGTGIVAGTLATVARVLDGSGNDVTGTLAAGNDVLTSPAGSAWEIYLGGGLSGDQAFYLDVSGGATAGAITVETETSPGSWQNVATANSRWNFDPLVVEAGGVTRARVSFEQETTIRRVGRVAIADHPQPQQLTMTSASHSKLGSVISAVSSAGGAEAVLQPGEFVVIDFSQPALASGNVRDYFLDLRGRTVNSAGGSSMREARGDSRTGTAAPVLAFALRQAEPTPFSRSTRIRFDLPRPAWVHLDVFDLQGRHIATLADEFLPSGHHAREWNGTGTNGGRVGPGVYLYRIRAGADSDQKKLVLMP